MNRLGPMMRYAAGLLSLVSLGLVLIPASAVARNRAFDVCTSGCAYSSLVAALADAPDGAKILVGPGTFEGSLELAKSVTIEGEGAAQTTLHAGPLIDSVYGTGPVISVDEGVTVTIRGVTLTGGIVEHFGGGIFNSGTLTVVDSEIRENRGGTRFDGHGGGIYNAATATLTLKGTTVADNVAADLGGSGGGIVNLGTARLVESAVSDNSSGWTAGAIENSGTMLLKDSIVSRNRTAGLFPGAIANDGTLTLKSSIVADNVAELLGWGGGIYNSGVTTLRDSLISGNHAYAGAGLLNVGILELHSSTVTANDGVVGGGLYNVLGRGTYELRSSTVTGNSGGDVFDGGEPCDVIGGCS